MKKYLLLLVVAFGLLLSKTSKVEAAIIISDSFSGGYNQSLWSILPGTIAPIPSSSSFGLSDTNDGASYGLLSVPASLPSDEIVKFEVRINSVPSNMLFSCKDLLAGFPANEKRAFMHSDGTFTLDSFQNGGGSNDGILHPWNNSPGIHYLELRCMGSNMTLIEDGVTLASWSNGFTFTPDVVRFQYWFGDSEFRNYQLCDASGCEAITPTPTNTPSPTPSATPTPSPTPTPIPVTKVVVIPGLGGSWNEDAIMNCKTEGYEGGWSLASYAADIYNPLLTELANAGWTTIPYYYDWRKQVPTHTTALADMINGNVADRERVDLVGHSMGGLVGRAYLEAQAEANKLDKLLTVGSPHKGTVFAYPPYSGGEIWEDNLRNKIAMTIALRRCDTRRLNNRETIRRVIPSVQNLLPVFNYLKDFRSGTVKPVTEMDAQNNWLPTTGFTPRFYGVTVGTLSGTGFKTLHELMVKPPSRLDTRRGDWLDGKPLLRRTTTDGDGTVLVTSSEVDGATTLQIPQSHTGLVASSQGINEILNFLGAGAGAISATSYIEPTSALVIIGYPADVWLTDPTGDMVKDKESLITILNPRAGSYTLRFSPKGEKATLIIAQFLENGKILWKEYPQSAKLPQVSTLRFDPINPLEDLLQ